MEPVKMQQGYFQHLLDEAHSHMLVLIGGTAGILVLITLVVFFAYRRWRFANERLRGAAMQVPLLQRLQGLVGRKSGPGVESSRETIFVVPDISGYTKFLAANQDRMDAAQNVVFELLNSIVAAAGRRLQLAKIEGDAVLFFDDLRKNSPKAMGDLLIDMFARFYEQRNRLASLDCPQNACCRTISELDLKIFVHAGQVSHFRFRDTPDIFGTDVVVLHRLMKNDLTTKRYLLVTDAVKDRVLLPKSFRAHRMIHRVDGFGDVAASVYQLDPIEVKAMASHQKKHWLSLSGIRARLLHFGRRATQSVNRSAKRVWQYRQNKWTRALRGHGK